MTIHTPLTCWIITEGLIGTENQCIGLADALGITPEIKRITLAQPWKTITPWIRPPLFINPISKKSDTLKEPWPDLVIAGGRKAIAPALWVKKQSKGKTFLTVVQNPYIHPKHFDLVIAPLHDGYTGPNVINTIAGLHKVTHKKLESANLVFEDHFINLPMPRIGIIIGGSSKHHAFTTDNAKTLALQLKALADKGHGLMITASRRTGADNEKILRDTLTHPNVYFWDGSGDNPYFGILSWADTLLVTQDSVSMTSEAISTGKPVYTIKMEGGSKRHTIFHDQLESLGFTGVFEGHLENWTYTPPHDTQMAAKKIAEHLGKRGITV